MSGQAAALGDVTAATSDSARCYARLLAGFVHVRNGQFAEAAAQFRPALADCDPREDTDLRANLGIAAFHLGDDHDVQAHYTRLLTDARESGALLLIVHALTRRACGTWPPATGTRSPPPPPRPSTWPAAAASHP